MKNYLKLVSFEINRFLKIYLSLAAMTVIIQFAVIIYRTQKYLGNVKEMLGSRSMTREIFLNNEGHISMTRVMDGFYQIPIAICIAGLLIYCFLIWYRDWFGKNAFIYRLLMLPTERINIYLAKATVIFLMVLGLVSLQLLLLPAEQTMMRLMVPTDFREDLPFDSLIIGFNRLGILFPTTLMDFVVHYGIGFMLVFALFTSILLERCYRIKGILFGIIYFVLAIVIFLIPMIMSGYSDTDYLYPNEYFFVEVFIGLFVTAISVLLSHYLLKKKIRV